MLSRETPALVIFMDKMRFLGTDSLAKQRLTPQNTVKRLLGRKFTNPAMQADLKRLPVSVSEAPDGSCLINVQFLNVGCRQAEEASGASRHSHPCPPSRCAGASQLHA